MAARFRAFEYLPVGKATTMRFLLNNRLLKEMGLTRLRVRIVGKAGWVVSFYKKLGYDLTDRIERHGSFDVILEKELQPPG